MEDHVLCSECGASILSATAKRTAGLCRPCADGTRVSIDAGKQYAAERKARHSDPFWTTWLRLVDIKHTSGFCALAPHERALYSMNHLKGAILRGGFPVYLEMTSVEQLRTAAESFRALGGEAIAALVERAERVAFPDGAPQHLLTREDILPAWPDDDIEPEWAEELEVLSREFYDVADHAEEIVARFFTDNFSAG